MTVESCIMAALFSVTPPTSSTLPDSQGDGEAAAPEASQEGGGASRTEEGEGPKEEDCSGNEVNNKSLRHHVSVCVSVYVRVCEYLHVYVCVCRSTVGRES